MTVTPEQKVERVKMALTEAGFPDATVRLVCVGRASVRVIGRASTGLTPRIVWRAFTVAGCNVPCWECFRVHAETGLWSGCAERRVEDCGIERCEGER